MALRTVNGIQLHCLDVPPGDPEATPGVPVVLVHGLGGSSSGDWAAQLPVFSRHRRIIAPCLRGFGRSDKPPGACTIPGFADDLHALLDDLAVSVAHLVGFSLGGAVALQAAVDRSERFASLVLASAVDSVEVAEWRRELLGLYRLGLGSSRGVDRMSRRLAAWYFPAPEAAPRRRALRARHRENHRPGYLAAIQALAGWSVAPRLADLRMPVLVLGGEHDRLGPPRLQRLAERVTRGRYVSVAGAASAAPFDDSERFNALVLAFLDEVEAGGSDPAKSPRTPPRPGGDGPGDYHMRSSGIGWSA